MKKSLFLFSLFCSVGIAYSDSPSRRSLSSVTSDVKVSTFVASRATPDVSNTSVSSGVVQVAGIFVSSPGANSVLRLYNNYLSGSTSNQIDGPLTSTYGWIPLLYETTNGLVMTSTCQTCSSSWTMPDYRISYERIR